MTEAWLICEGVFCNPTIAAVDRQMAKAPGDAYRWTTAHRNLVYTRHTVDGDQAVCTVCHTKRRYGGNRQWGDMHAAVAKR